MVKQVGNIFPLLSGIMAAAAAAKQKLQLISMGWKQTLGGRKRIVVKFVPCCVSRVVKLHILVAEAKKSGKLWKKAAINKGGYE